MRFNFSEQCAITKSSPDEEFPKLSVSTLSYGGELQFTCPDEDGTRVKCTEPGTSLLVTCQGELLKLCEFREGSMCRLFCYHPSIVSRFFDK